jgi:hypothetical protein
MTRPNQILGDGEAEIADADKADGGGHFSVSLSRVFSRALRPK